MKGKWFQVLQCIPIRQLLLLGESVDLGKIAKVVYTAFPKATAKWTKGK